MSGSSSATPDRGGINLVVWVDRKSPPLNALGATLETALAESRRRFNCPDAGPACYTLDVQMVDSRDVLERRGYGALVNNMYVRSTGLGTPGHCRGGSGGRPGSQTAVWICTRPSTPS